MRQEPVSDSHEVKALAYVAKNVQKLLAYTFWLPISSSHMHKLFIIGHYGTAKFFTKVTMYCLRPGTKKPVVSGPTGLLVTDPIRTA